MSGRTNGPGVAETAPGPSRLTILYDEQCALCRRARDWMLAQPCLVPVELLAAGSPQARRRYGRLPLAQELVVVDDSGRAWIGPSAFMMCLWATARYRPVAYRLSDPSLERLGDKFFDLISKNRHRLGRLLADEDTECLECQT